MRKALCTYSNGPLVVGCSWNWLSFSCSCPPNYTNTGLSCAANTITKASYGRGAGVPLVCDPSLQEDRALCYPRCKQGYKGVGPVCWLDAIDANSFCASLYDSTLASFSMQHGWTTTYGFGAGMDIGATVAGETGVVYGNDGHYGCYVQTCGGVTTKIGINAWGTFGYTTLGFDSVGGTSLIVDVGGQLDPNSLTSAGWPISGETATVWSTSGQKLRSTASLILGQNADWHLPISGNQLTRQTWVTQLW